jgi:thymidylate synthase
MNGIPVLTAQGDCIARAWENALLALYQSGCDIQTQYDKPQDPLSKDSTMVLVVEAPLAEPMIHRDFPGGFEELEEYVLEVCEGIKDHCVRNPDDPHDTRWEYTYHQRLFGYELPGNFGERGAGIDQIDSVCRQLAESPHTRRAQAITWKVWEDNTCYDPPCLQSIWCRISDVKGASQEDRVLNMNVRFRSNDAYKAAFMNIFALVRLQARIAERIAAISGRPVRLGRYCHIADSFHIYGSNLREFEARFLGAIQRRSFADRTMRYEDVREIMEGARPGILEKARRMGRDAV